MYAIIETGGKQVKVTKGEEVFVEKLDVEADETVTFDKLLFVGGSETKVGAPYVDCASVSAKVVGHSKGKKITVFKYKPMKYYSRKQGHRQPYTKLVIESISV